MQNIDSGSKELHYTYVWWNKNSTNRFYGLVTRNDKNSSGCHHVGLAQYLCLYYKPWYICCELGDFSLSSLTDMFTLAFEQPHDKTNKMACTPSEDSNQPEHPPSLVRVFDVSTKQAWVLSYTLSAQRRLIRLGRCRGWSESSLGAHAILLILSWGGSFCSLKHE